ncbi:acyl-CoA dehydrogenase family protein [Rhodococcus sp. IEGM 1305]|uniref:acyl-CoA dehydrogenase family protein n=1 Tax=Rhodococcus sp. IEGM 1305 TaxID=3047092 RepID=UPI0024B7338C|nr:acyl-CoA dehydrogenase family protein [Rhodococcus sp. IEGM 1305]MDI9953273.1 acyl-CoA dehydrogenase family protein [Rhodococcus sp. IEGM 1305]
MPTPTTVDQDLVEMMTSVFASHREHHAATIGTATLDTGLWNQLKDLGLVRLTGREENGGSGASWFEAAELLRATAWNGVRVPLPEHDLLACWLLDVAGLAGDERRRTVCVLDDNGNASGVPWAATSEKVVTVWRNSGTYRVADVETSALTVATGTNLANEPRDTVTADITTLAGTPVPDAVIDQLRLRGALVRGLQVCAALERILDLSIVHTTERVQFGRALAKFQAVQNLVADIAAETSLARAATDAALTQAVRTDWSGTSLEFLIAVARSCAGHAASVVVRNAHQVHGAIGTTREHRLHEFTNSALAWRSEFGSVHHWDDTLTTAAVTAGRKDLWGLITG